MSDALTTIFIRQRELQVKSYGHDPGRLEQDDKIDYIRWNVLALEDELHEALGEVGWKPWATSRHINRAAYVGELVDALHFLVNLFLAVDAGADEVLQRYLEKREKNIARMAAGYDGVTGKCPGCGRDLADAGVGCRRNGNTVYCAEDYMWYGP